MKEYERAKVEVVAFSAEDVITASTEDPSLCVGECGSNQGGCNECVGDCTTYK